jgi:hypothetical protein
VTVARAVVAADIPVVVVLARTFVQHSSLAVVVPVVAAVVYPRQFSFGKVKTRAVASVCHPPPEQSSS